MKINPKTWNQKQKIVSGAVVVLLVVGGIGGGYSIHEANVHAQQIAVQKAKVVAEKKVEAAHLSQAKGALLKAEKEDSIANVSAAQKAVNALKDKSKAKKDGNAELDSIHARIQLEVAAKNAVDAFKKDASNATKDKGAHTAVDKLSNPYSKALKDALNKQIAASEAQAKATAAKAKADADAKAAAEAKTKAEEAAQAQNAANSQQNQTVTNNAASGYDNTYSGSGTPSNGGASNYSGGATSNTNTGGSTNSPTPTPTPSNPATPSAPPASATPSSPSTGTGGAANPNVSIDQANKYEQDAGNSSNHFPGGW